MAGGGMIGGVGGNAGDFNLKRPLPAGLRQEAGAEADIHETVELSRNTPGTGATGAETFARSDTPATSAPANRQPGGPAAVNAPTVLTMIEQGGPGVDFTYPDGVNRVGDRQVYGMYGGLRAEV